MTATLHFRLRLTSFRFSWQQRDAERRQKSCRRQPFTDKMAEVEETLKRIEAHKGVIGTIVVNAEGEPKSTTVFSDMFTTQSDCKGYSFIFSGIPIRTTLDNSTTVQYAGLLRQLTMKARSTVRDIDPQNDLTFLRIRSKKHEILVAPENDFLLIVIQNPCE
ncbi:dynein light chain roadblock-type 2 isoform X1 [Siniperca chuatsi]|uniref:dynein light chain roadblock-type 2 isoform X1 n=1 Tax=Siniperca chuatsi TaxID=119488 RepID=UPI001CE1420B|nr:dynein light chain roadblock-type 2 isoform X1 [Siniperca chuatsi]